MTLGEVTVDDKGMSPRRFGRDPADILIRIRINSFGADVDRSRHKGLSAVVDKSRHLGGECCNVQ